MMMMIHILYVVRFMAVNGSYFIIVSSIVSELYIGI